MQTSESRPPNLKLIASVVAALFVGGAAYYLNLGQMYWMGVMLGAIPVVAYLFSRAPLRTLAFTRSSPQRLHEGDDFEVSLSLSHAGRVPRAGLWIQDTLPAWIEPQTPAAFSVPLLWGSSPVALRYRAAATKRGEHPLGPLVVAARDPLGMFEQRRRVGQPQTILVYPQILPLGARETAGVRAHSGTESGRANIAGEGIEFYGIRDYRPGDELRRIDWKATARLGDLVVTEYDQSMAADLVIALDLLQGSDLGEGRESTLEYAARIAASLASYALHRGATCALIASHGGQPEVVTASRLSDLDRVLEVLARAKAVEPAPLSSVVARAELRLPAEGVLVLVTAAPDPGLATLAHDWLARRLRVVILALDAASFSGRPPQRRGPADRDAVLDGLAALGVACQVVRRGDDLTSALNRAVAGLPDRASSRGGAG